MTVLAKVKWFLRPPKPNLRDYHDNIGKVIVVVVKLMNRTPLKKILFSRSGGVIINLNALGIHHTCMRGMFEWGTRGLLECKGVSNITPGEVTNYTSIGVTRIQTQRFA